MKLGHFPPSLKQIELLKRLTLSSAFSEDEARKTMTWLGSSKANMLECSVLIDKALKRIAERDGRRKASRARREQAAAARDEMTLESEVAKVAKPPVSMSPGEAIFGH